MFTNGYNMLEPEHSQQFIKQQIEILMPQVFGLQSILELEEHRSRVAHVFFKEESALIEKLRAAAPSMQFRQIEKEVPEDKRESIDLKFAHAGSFV